MRFGAPTKAVPGAPSTRDLRGGRRRAGGGEHISHKGQSDGVYEKGRDPRTRTHLHGCLRGKRGGHQGVAFPGANGRPGIVRGSGGALIASRCA